MTSFYDTFKTDERLECETGLELDYGACGVITIRRAGGANQAFQRVLAAKFKPYERQAQTDTLDPAVNRRLLAETYGETVIVGWRGVKDETGNDLHFSPENAVKLLLDLPELFADIRAQATTAANFRRASVEETAKNSPVASATS